MNVVFCTTCKGRVQHLARTLPDNLEDNPDSKFVVLDYNDQSGLEQYLQKNHSIHIDSGRLIIYQYREPVGFHMAHSKNLAHRLGAMEGGDVLVNLDADNYTGRGFDFYINDELEGRDDVFLWSRMIKEGEGKLSRGISGRIVVPKSGFFLAGGYDQKYRTYSPDDKDFNARLRRLGLHAKEIHPKHLKAILHTDKMRFREYPEAASDQSCGDFQIDHGPSIANEGAIGCGLVYRNFSRQPVYVSPVPTRVFGIGMHKTATTSLHHALNTLGLKCAHWPSAHWAKAVWREMNEHGRSASLEQYYAATDLPMPLLFRRLDTAYPGSKFILTVRDERKWLESIRKHWSCANTFRQSWDNDPFSNRVHQILYGRTDFHEATFLTRYRRHNAEVLEHFKNRPQDLLVMDMEKGAGYKELCGFLNLPVPNEAYPHSFKTQR